MGKESGILLPLRRLELDTVQQIDDIVVNLVQTGVRTDVGTDFHDGRCRFERLVGDISYQHGAFMMQRLLQRSMFIRSLDGIVQIPSGITLNTATVSVIEAVYHGGNLLLGQQHGPFRVLFVREDFAEHLCHDFFAAYSDIEQMIVGIGNPFELSFGDLEPFTDVFDLDTGTGSMLGANHGHDSLFQVVTSIPENGIDLIFTEQTLGSERDEECVLAGMAGDCGQTLIHHVATVSDFHCTWKFELNEGFGTLIPQTAINQLDIGCLCDILESREGFYVLDDMVVLLHADIEDVAIGVVVDGIQSRVDILGGNDQIAIGIRPGIVNVGNRMLHSVDVQASVGQHLFDLVFE